MLLFHLTCSAGAYDVNNKVYIHAATENLTLNLCGTLLANVLTCGLFLSRQWRKVHVWSIKSTARPLCSLHDCRLSVAPKDQKAIFIKLPLRLLVVDLKKKNTPVAKGFSICSEQSTCRCMWWFGVLLVDACALDCGRDSIAVLHVL